MGRPGNEAICEEVESTERGSIEVTGGCSLLQLQKNEVGRLMNKTMSSDPNHHQVTVHLKIPYFLDYTLNFRQYLPVGAI